MSFLLSEEPISLIDKSEYIKNELLSKTNICPSDIKISYEEQTVNIHVKNLLLINLWKRNEEWIIECWYNHLFQIFNDIPNLIDFIKNKKGK